MGEWIALPPESTAVRRGDHSNPARRQLEHLREGTVDVVRGLGTRPECQPAVSVVASHRRMLLDWQVGVPLEEDEIILDQVGSLQTSVHVAEFEMDQFVDISIVGVIVNSRIGSLGRFRHGADRRQDLILNVDEIKRRGGDVFVPGGDCCDFIADEAHVIGSQGMLVLAHRQDAEGNRQVLPGNHGMHPVQRLGPAGIDLHDPCVGMGAPQHPATQHAGQDHVVREDGLTGALGRGIHLGARRSDHPVLPARVPTGSHRVTPWRAPPVPLASGPPRVRWLRRS